jgi:hypothetical protein
LGKRSDALEMAAFPVYLAACCTFEKLFMAGYNLVRYINKNMIIATMTVFDLIRCPFL